MRIRHAELDDAEQLAGFLLRNRDYFQHSEPIRGEGYFTVAEQRRRIEQAVENRESGRSEMFLIEFDGQVVGRMALGGIVRGAFQSAGVGYALDQALTGRGIATIALRLLVRHAFEGLNLHRLQAETQVTNVASGRVLARCGFEHYGRAAQYARINGVWQAVDFYQLVNDDCAD